MILLFNIKCSMIGISFVFILISFGVVNPREHPTSDEQVFFSGETAFSREVLKPMQGLLFKAATGFCEKLGRFYLRKSHS